MNKILEEAFKELNQQLYLIESKEDQKRFVNWAGQDLANRFYNIKDRLQGQEKDIYYWMGQNKNNLEYKLKHLGKTAREKAQEAKKGAELIYSDPTWNVFHITTYGAAVRYGKGTKWCISSKHSSIDWDSYTKTMNNNFYFYINKNDKFKKYALQYEPATEIYMIWKADDDPDGSWELTLSGVKELPKIQGLPDVTAPYFNYSRGNDKYRIIDGKLIQSDFDWNSDGELPKNIIEIGPGGLFGFSAEVLTIPKSVKNISIDAFIDINPLSRDGDISAGDTEYIVFEGSKAQWNSFDIANSEELCSHFEWEEEESPDEFLKDKIKFLNK